MKSMPKENPKQVFGSKKIPFSTIPVPVLGEVAVGMLEGAYKYGRHNYRSLPITSTTYYDATLRHLMAWWEGEDIDAWSGLSHITKAICSLIVLRDAMMQNKWNDDRPIKSVPWIEALNAATEILNEKHPNPVQPFLERDKSWKEDD
jgi:hypothetical protein